MKKAISGIAFLLVFGLLPIEASSQESWGALFWHDVDEQWSPHNIPWDDQKCNYVASIAWNYPKKREAMIAARKGCRREWRKTGLRVPLKSKYCGDLKQDDPIAGGTVGGVVFGPGQCAAYASGQRFVRGKAARCPILGEGVGMSKQEAERRALADCKKNFRSTTCKIKLSACNAPR